MRGRYTDRLARSKWTVDYRGSCPDCESDLVLRDGKFGEFLGCSNYPDCTFTQNVDDRHERGDFSPLLRDVDGHHY